MKAHHFAAILAISAALTACGASNRTLGTLGGAGVGAGVAKAVGGGTLAVVAGAVAGAWLGGELGGRLDEKDRNQMQSTTQAALERGDVGETESWRNPDSGNSGTVTPQQRFTNADGRECREYRQTVTANGKTETGYGTACKQADGSWRVVSG